MVSLMNDSLPFMMMVMLQCCGVTVMFFSKAVTNVGLNSLVYVAYRSLLGTMIFLPIYICHRRRSNLPPLSRAILCKFFFLGLIGICVFPVFGVLGVKYSSPTLASAIGNLDPAVTFILAVVCRMERFDFRRLPSQVKILGTITAISGALVMIFYKGPLFLIATQSYKLHQELILSQKSNWVLGGGLIVFSCIFSSSFNIALTTMVKEYPDETTIAFFSCLFGTIQCLFYSLIVVRDTSAWVLKPGVEIIAVVYSAIFMGVVRIPAVTWCLRKKGPVFVAMFRPTQMVIAVIMGLIFFGDALCLGSVIGGTIIAVGFYAVMWGAAKEKEMFLDCNSDLESSSKTTPLLKT